MSVVITAAPALIGGPAPAAARSHAGMTGPVLLGREPELSLLGDLVRPGREDGGVLVLTGDPGIGKSSLLAAARELAITGGYRVLTVIGAEAEARLPWSGLHQLLGPLARDLDALPGPQQAALRSAFGDAEDTEAEPFLVSLAALTLLADEAVRRPLAVLADDVQWLDQQTHDTLAFLGRRIGMDPIVVLGTIRTGHRGTFTAAGFPEIAVAPLDSELAVQLLEREAPHLGGAVRRRILVEAQGVPLALVELPKAVTGQAEIAGPGETLPVTSRLVNSFAGRLTQLADDARDLLLVAAVDDSDQLAEIVAASGRLAGFEMPVSAVEPVIAAGLVTVDENRVRFRHPLVRAAVLQEESLARRLAASGALAAVLDDDPYRRSWHRAQSIVGPDDAVAQELADSVRFSMTRGAVSAAIRSLERSAQLSTDPGVRGHRLLVAAEYAFGLGRGDTVDRLVTAASAYPLGRLDLARVQWLREIFHDGVPGDAGRVIDLCELAADAAQHGDLSLALNLLHGASLRCWWADTGPEARARVVAVARALPVEATADPRWICLLAVAEPILEAGAVLTRLQEIPLEEVVDADELRLYGMAAHAAGDAVLARAFLERAEAKLRAQGRVGHLSHVLAMLVGDRLLTGEWDRAAAAADEAFRHGLESGQSVWSTGAMVGRARMAAVLEPREQALSLCAEAEAPANGRRLNNLLSCIELARGMAWLSSGRPEEAFGHFQRVLDPDDPAHHQRESFYAIMLMAESALHCGRAAEVTPVLDRLAEVGKLTPAPELHLQLAYARAVLADDATADELYQDALGHDLTGWPWIRARLQLAYGTWLRRQRRVAESRPHLRAAVATLDVVGAGMWAEQARTELRASGERTEEARTSVHDLLSPQELHIAQLAAEGLSNKEIGQQLYLSPRTVGSHLYRMFPKLGVTSRNQLAARLVGS